MKRALIVIEAFYAIVSLGVAIALLLRLGPVADATNATSIRILGGAVLAIGLGAVFVAHDPVRNRAILGVQIVFAVVSALAIGWKYLAEDSDRALMILGPLAFFIVVLLAFSPGAWPRKGAKRRRPAGRR